MSSMSKVAELSKYIKSLPNTKFSISGILILSTIIGIIISITEPLEINFLEKIFYGAIIGLISISLSSILSAIIEYKTIEKFNGINLKKKHALFLSFSNVLIILIITLIFFIINIFSIELINGLFFSCVIIFSWNFLVIYGTTNISEIKSALLALIQPLLLIIVLIIVGNIIHINLIIQIGVVGSLIKFIIGCLIFLIGIHIFINITKSPLKNNLGYDGVKLLTYFIAHMNEGLPYLEELFESSGEEIDTVVGIISFKNLKGEIKALFLSPSVHPGPIGDVGGANLPTILAEKYPYFTMVAHGPSTHDFNPVSTKEIDKIEKSVNEGLEEIKYSKNASHFKRFRYEKANIGVQFFDEGMMMLSTFAPSGSDDIEFSTGLAMMIESQKTCNIKNSIIVDCHNSFNEEKGGVLPGNPEVFQILNAINKIDNKNEKYPLRIGISSNQLETLDKTNGVGESGLKVMVIETGDQKVAIALFDSNNMELGFREKILKELSDLPVDEIEVLTTDTHTVNTLSNGYNPIGLTKKDEIIECLRKSILEAIDDLEEVEAGTNLKKIVGLKAFGANNSVELVSTISSTVIVGKKIFPLIFIIFLLFEIIWIFYL